MALPSIEIPSAVAQRTNAGSDRSETRRSPPVADAAAGEGRDTPPWWQAGR
jgi:hypothetical protein